MHNFVIYQWQTKNVWGVGAKKNISRAAAVCSESPAHRKLCSIQSKIVTNTLEGTLSCFFFCKGIWDDNFAEHLPLLGKKNKKKKAPDNFTFEN